MKDIQSQVDHRHINIKKVGVKNITYPITVLDKAKKLQKTIATVNMYVNLPHRFKGTHMSRFVEILNRFHGEIDLQSFHHILEEVKVKLEAEEAHIEIEFPYFLEKNKEGRNVVSMGEYTCRMHGSLSAEYDFLLEVDIPISPPLPGQSNEALPRSLGHWGEARVCIRFRHFIWIEDLIQTIEEAITVSRSNNFSSTSLKKDSGQIEPDNNSTVVDHEFRSGSAGEEFPMSVENITKSLAVSLTKHADISWFRVSVENFSEGYSVYSAMQWPFYENMVI